MAAIACKGDEFEGGNHCHPRPDHACNTETPGKIIEGSSRVFIDGKPVAREGDKGLSLKCCGHIGLVVIQKSQNKVFVEGKAVATVGTPTLHCGIGRGRIKEGCEKVQIIE